MKLSRGVLATALLIAPAGVHAQDARPKVVDDLAKCRAIAGSAERLACYDQKVEALTAATDSKTIVVLDKGEVQRTRRSLFGFTLPKLPFFGNEKADDDANPHEDTAIRQLDTTVVNATQSGYDLWTLILAEGGTWRTTQPDRIFTARAGQKITIKRGVIGGYMANVGGQRGVRVERAR